MVPRLTSFLNNMTYCSFIFQVSLIFYSFYVSLCSASEDLALRETGVCSEACIKNILKKILFRNEPLQRRFEGAKWQITLDAVEVDQLIEYISNDDTWTSGDSILEKLTSSTERVYDDDFGHKYQDGLSPKVVIIMCTGAFAVATVWTILTGRSSGLAVTIVMTLAFFCGLAWNWWKSYTEEFHRRVHQLPPECQPDTTSWFHSVKGFIIDPQCNEYFKSPVDDPLSMVSPGSVLEATFKMIFVKPIAMLVSTFTSTTHDLTSNITWPFNMILQSILSLLMIGGITIALLILVVSLVGREFSFSLGMVSGKMHGAKNNLRPKGLGPKKKSLQCQPIQAFPVST